MKTLKNLLLDELAEIAAEYKGSPAINAAIIRTAQKVEHYNKIVSYRCLHERAEFAWKPASRWPLRPSRASAAITIHTLISDFIQSPKHNNQEGNQNMTDGLGNKQTGQLGLIPIVIPLPEHPERIPSARESEAQVVPPPGPPSEPSAVRSGPPFDWSPGPSQAVWRGKALRRRLTLPLRTPTGERTTPNDRM